MAASGRLFYLPDGYHKTALYNIVLPAIPEKRVTIFRQF